MIGPSPAIDWEIITVYTFKATVLIPAEAISWGKLDLGINTIALEKQSRKRGHYESTLTIWTNISLDLYIFLMTWWAVPQNPLFTAKMKMWKLCKKEKSADLKRRAQMCFPNETMTNHICKHFLEAKWCSQGNLGMSLRPDTKKKKKGTTQTQLPISSKAATVLQIKRIPAKLLASVAPDTHRRTQRVCAYHVFMFAYTAYMCARHRERRLCVCVCVCAAGEGIMSRNTVGGFLASRGEVKRISSLIHFSWLFSFQISSLCTYGWRVDSLLSLSIFWGKPTVRLCLVLLDGGSGQGGCWWRSRLKHAGLFFFNQSLMTISVRIADRFLAEVGELCCLFLSTHTDALMNFLGRYCQSVPLLQCSWVPEMQC